MKNVKRRRGFSLLEAIIALAVITIVSAATVSLLLSSASLDGENFRMMQIYNEAENAVECFRFDKTNFKANVERANGACTANGEELVWEKEGYTSKIIVYDETRLEYTAVTKSGEVIYAFTYQNGAYELIYPQGGQS